MYCPNDTQYQRLIQKISATIEKTEKSKISPKNKLMSKMQAFGNSGQREDFSPKRETTLGYFSVKPTFDLGPSCVRFNARSTNVSPLLNMTMKEPLQLKTELQKQITTVTERTSNISVFESGQQPMRATDYSTRSNRSPWMTAKDMKQTSISVNEELSQQEMRNSRQNQRVNEIHQARRVSNVAISDASSIT